MKKFVDPGALKIDAASSNANIYTTAFRNPDGSTVVLAYNDRQKTEKVYVTDGNVGFEYNMLKKSAVTFVWSGSAPPPTPPAAPDNLLANAAGANVETQNYTDGAHQKWRFDLVAGKLQQPLPQTFETQGMAVDLILYPNPVRDMLQIILPAALTTSGRLDCYDQHGHRLLSKELDAWLSGTVSVAVKSLPAGIYYITLTASGKMLSAKSFMISR